MKNIINNMYNLKEEEMTEVVKRVKALLINSKNEIMLGYSYNEYQFPGGHVEDNESLVQTLNREMEEETGMVLNLSNIEPFACLSGYWKDWPEKGKNRKTEVYYFKIFTDEIPNLKATNYTKEEKDGNFELRYIPLDELEYVLTENAKNYGDKKGITKEMLTLFEHIDKI